MNQNPASSISATQRWQMPMKAGRKLPTFWQRNLLQEISVLALLLVLFSVFGIAALGELKRHYFIVYRAAADNVELVLNEKLQQAKHELIRFSQLPQQQQNEQTVLLLADYSEIYRLDTRLSITQILKRNPSSQIFKGFSFARSPLIDYLNQTSPVDDYSPLLRGIEDSRASIYIALPTSQGILMGRVNLEALQRFVRQFARAAQTPVMVVARDGSILLTSDPQLRIPAFPHEGIRNRQVVREPLEFAGRRWIPIVTPARSVGASIVTLVPIERLIGEQQRIITLLIGVSIGSGLLLALKSLQMRRLFIQPISQLAAKMRSLESGNAGEAHGQRPSTISIADAAQEPPAQFAELETIQTAFAAMAEAIREREQRLRQSEQQHRLLADNALDVITICDPTGRPTYISPSIEKVRGWSVAEAMLLPMDQHLKPEGSTFVRNSLAQTREAVQAALPLPNFRVELQQSHKNGSWIWTDVTSSCIVDETGTYIGTMLVYRDITERKRLEAELQQRAASDDLTGLLNRRALIEQLEARLSPSDRGGGTQGLALLFCDLDRFKEINDTLGHTVGDAILQITAGRICRCLRSGDLAARMGGDEIVVALPEIANQEAALIIAETISRAVSQPITVMEAQIVITASIGVTLARPQEELDELMARADQGMYQAKQAGRNCVTSLP